MRRQSDRAQHAERLGSFSSEVGKSGRRRSPAHVGKADPVEPKVDPLDAHIGADGECAFAGRDEPAIVAQPGTLGA
jgi:hypothetical protein